MKSKLKFATSVSYLKLILSHLKFVYSPS